MKINKIKKKADKYYKKISELQERMDVVEEFINHYKKVIEKFGYSDEEQANDIVISEHEFLLEDLNLQQKKYQKRLKKLQKKCPHNFPNGNGAMLVMGYYNDETIFECSICGKIIIE